MKKLLILAVVAITSLCASAQHYIGGSLGATYEFSKKETNVTVAPEWGYTYTDHWGVGIVLDYNYKKYPGQVVNGFSFNPYARWTFARVADDKLAFFLDNGFSIGFSKVREIPTGVFYTIGIKPGLCYSFNEHWSILTHVGFLGYQGANGDARAMGYEKKIGLDFSSMNVNLGVYYTF